MLPVWRLTSRSPDWFAGRGRPPQAAARRAGLEFVEKLLTRNLISTCAARVMLDTSARSADAATTDRSPSTPAVDRYLAWWRAAAR